MNDDDFYAKLMLDIPWIKPLNTYARVIPCPIDSTPIPKIPLKTRIMRRTIYILKNIGLLLLFMIVAVGITMGFGYLDRIIGAGGALIFFSYVIDLFLGVIASQIVFQ